MNIEQYLEAVERDFDYYLFWAEEVQDSYYDELVEVILDGGKKMKMQIRIAHLLMDEGQTVGYQEDGYILGEIIFDSLKKEIDKVNAGQ